MNSVDKAIETQLENIQTKTGKTLDELYALIRKSGLTKHGEILELLKRDLGMGHGDAARLGPFEIAPKKTYVSLRRKKQFAMIGPATKTRVEVGLNMKGVEPTARLVALPVGGMCQYKVDVTDAKEVDEELITWIRQAYDSAG